MQFQSEVDLQEMALHYLFFYSHFCLDRYSLKSLEMREFA